MALSISLLPYMNRISEAQELLYTWEGGIEILTDGPEWREHPYDWQRERGRFSSYSGPLSVHAPIFEVNLAASRYRTIREYSFAVYKQSVEWAAAIGATHVVIHPNMHLAPIFRREQAQAWAKVYLRNLGRLAHDVGVKVVVENVGAAETALFNQVEFTQLFAEIPEIDALVDIGHAHMNRWDVPSLLRQLGERVAAVHVHDNDGVRDLHLPVGTGTIDWDPVWAALGEYTHDCTVILEYGIGTPLDTLLAHGEEVARRLAEESHVTLSAQQTFHEQRSGAR
ncbi:sugar phosphate isomerase/epimerase family protein [Numidum massiliense]|uniref:sugar phosphate isomerase/epimerase family protein n=1 Tax=Numidum massiliense TaxID=1522315 RepID=UPI00093EE1A4|nr:sugar phosphate isomerase/epimerase [Numidum massiliense]